MAKVETEAKPAMNLRTYFKASRVDLTSDKGVSELLLKELWVFWIGW